MALLGPQDDRLNGPPPNPVTSPAAAQESSPIRTLTGGVPPTGGLTGMPAGPDMSGILALGEKITEGLLTLAQALPAQAGLIDQSRAMLENALASWVQTQSSSGAGLPTSPPPGVVTQAGTQFPGGGFQAGRAF